MRRRDFLLAAGGVAAFPGFGDAQQQLKMLRVGTAFPLPRTVPFWLAFEQKLVALGYQEGKNITFDYIQTSGFEGLDSGYREIVARKPDILVAAGPEQSLKSARATAGTLPIVMIAVDYDPLTHGHIASLAQPGGNVSGVYFQSTDLVGKRLQLIKEIVPERMAAAVLRDQASAHYWAVLQAAAPRFGLRLTSIEFHDRPYDYERVITEIAPADRTVLLAASSPFFFQDRTILTELALRIRTPLMLNNREGTVVGGLMSYAPSLSGMFELAANYVDQIARGSRPSDLAVQQPTKFEMVINLKTAKTIGIDVPPLLLAQADEVIE